VLAKVQIILQTGELVNWRVFQPFSLTAKDAKFHAKHAKIYTSLFTFHYSPARQLTS
jgi:hypothetical protein